jgi:putative membrane protein
LADQVASVSWTDWHAHPSIIVGVVLITALYLMAVGPLRERFGWAERGSSSQMVLFMLGVLVIVVALLSPLHELGDKYLFSAHMAQHLLLMLVVPPLLLLGVPGWLVDKVLRSPRVLAVSRFLTRPLVAFTFFNAVLVLWHMPVLYDLTLRERDIHILEHVMFLGVAVLMWWPVLSLAKELPRASYITQMVYLFLLPTVPGILGAVITFSDKVLYPWYAEAPRLWNISATTDQEIGGIIMWVPGGMAFLTVLIIVFLVWANQEESKNRTEVLGIGR